MVREYVLHLGSGDRLLLPVSNHVGLVWGDPGKRVHRHYTRSTDYMGSIHCCLRGPPYRSFQSHVDPVAAQSLPAHHMVGLRLGLKELELGEHLRDGDRGDDDGCNKDYGDNSDDQHIGSPANPRRL